jgi:hypothetical protein
MSKFAKVLAAVALMAGAIAVSSPAQARWHGGWHHGWHGGGYGWGPGLALGFGLGYPYYYGYGGPYYAAQPACGWRSVRVWRGDHWALRRAWRC